jgi:hypothetical protein
MGDLLTRREALARLGAGGLGALAAATDALTDRVHAQAPYAARGQRRVRNARDGIYRDAGGQLTLAVAPAPDGYAASFDLALETG